jgi:dipeptidyl aminopeptidase/acylaminoacyl peptidase
LSDTRELLRRGVEGFEPMPDAFERVLARRDRKRRNQRIAAGVVGIAVFVAAVWIVTTGGSFNRTQQPAIQPTPTPPASLHHPSGIALSNGELIDPTTGGSIGSLPIPDATDMSWSPDGSSLVYAAPDGVFVLVVDTHDTRQLVPCGTDRHACTVAWSPTGDEIAVAHDEVLEVVSVDGGGETPVTSFPGVDLIRDPSWSPDGEQLAFSVIGPSGTPRALYTVARDGSDLTRIVEGTPEAIGPWAPSWSPDGSRIAYIDSNAWGKGHRAWELNVTVVDPDGTNATVLTGAGSCFCLGFVPGLDWSPDGTRLAVSMPELAGHDSDRPGGLYTVDADGSGLTRLGRYVNWSPAWRPAG